MDGQRAVWARVGMVSSLAKKGNSDTGHNTDEPGGRHAQQNKPVTNRQIPVIPHTQEALPVVKSQRQTPRAGRQGQGGEENGEPGFRGDGASVFQDEESSVAGWWCPSHSNVTAFHVLNTTELQVKNSNMLVDFTCVFLPHQKAMCVKEKSCILERTL